MVDKKKDERICIVGAGPAGISAAMYLEQKGYKNYVIYEKEDRVGGKTYSPTYKGKRYEMGAIMGVPSYYAVADCEKFAGIAHKTDEYNNADHNGPLLERKYKNAKGKVVEPFSTKKFWRIPHLMRLKKQIKRIGYLLETKYKGYDVTGHIGVSEGKYDGFAVTPGREPVSGTNPNLKDLTLPFAEFCRINKVPLIQEVWIAPFVAFGYGFFDEIPAAYVLKYLDFQTMMNFAKINLWTWKNGTQSIFENVNNKLVNPAVLNSNITAVSRTKAKVTVTVNGQKEVFDKIIITAPLQYMPQYFDATKDEKELFSKIDFESYDVQSCLIKKGDYPETSYYIMDNMVKEKLGHLMVYFRRWKGEEDQPITTYTLRKHKDMKEVPYEDAKATVLKDMKICDCEVDKVIKDISWYYFPHVFSKDYADGWYEKVEAMQGKKNTFYAGEIMSFGDMDETCEYSHDLVERFF